MQCSVLQSSAVQCHESQCTGQHFIAVHYFLFAEVESVSVEAAVWSLASSLHPHHFLLTQVTATKGLEDRFYSLSKSNFKNYNST